MNQGVKTTLLLLRNSIMAVLQGKFLLKLNVGKYMVHIIFCFFMFSIAIWFSMMVDLSLHKVEENYETIDDLQMINAQYRFELEELHRRGEIEKRLARMGSELHDAQKPATVIVE